MICALCLGQEHAELALASGGCESCEALPMSTLRARLEAFNPEAVTPPFVGPRKKKRRSQRQPEPVATATRSPENLPRASLSPSPPPFTDAQLPLTSLTAVASEDEAEGHATRDCCSILASDSEDWSLNSASSSIQESGRTRAGADAELMRLLTQAVDRLGLEWSLPKEPALNRLDGCFLHRRRSAPVSRPAPFLPELHT